MSIRRIVCLVCILISSYISCKEVKDLDSLNKKIEDFAIARNMNCAYKVDQVNAEGGLINIAYGSVGVVNRHENFQKDQLCSLMSATKNLTAAVVLKYYEKGLLKLTDTVADIIKEDNYLWAGNPIPEWAKKITVHHLLSYSSGLPDYQKDIENEKVYIPSKDGDVLARQKLMKHISLYKILFQPGEKYWYSTTDWVILSFILEAISNKTTPEIFEEEVFKPLEMHASFVPKHVDSDEILKNDGKRIKIVRYLMLEKDSLNSLYSNLFRSFGDFKANIGKIIYIYLYSDRRLEDNNFIKLEAPSMKTLILGQAGVVTNAEDMSKWLYNLHYKNFLSTESYTLMINAYQKDSCGSSFGYGTQIPSVDGIKLVGHTGSALGARAEIYYLPKTKHIITIFSNQEFKPRPGCFATGLSRKKEYSEHPEKQWDIEFLRNFIVTEVSKKSL